MAIPFVYIQARGFYRELGRAVGEGARDAIHGSVAFYRDNFCAMTQGRLSFTEAERLTLAYAEEARRWTPRHLEELEGSPRGQACRSLSCSCRTAARSSPPPRPPGADSGPWRRAGRSAETTARRSRSRPVAGT